MSKTNNLIFKGLSIIAWIIFVGLCIEAGALIVNFIISFFKPEIIQNLYQKLDLSKIDLGKGKRQVILQNSQYDKKYQITVPKEYGENPF